MYSSFSTIPTVLFIWCFANPEILSSSPNVWYIDWFELTKTCWTMRFFQTRNASKCVPYRGTWFQNGPYQPGSELTQGDFKADFSSSTRMLGEHRGAHTIISSTWDPSTQKKIFCKKKNVLHVAISYICSRQLLRNSILLERCLVWLKQQTPQPCNGWPPHWTRQPSAMPLSDTLNTSGSSPFLPWLCWNDTSVLFWNVQNSME